MEECNFHGLGAHHLTSRGGWKLRSVKGLIFVFCLFLPPKAAKFLLN